MYGHSECNGLVRASVLRVETRSSAASRAGLRMVRGLSFEYGHAHRQRDQLCVCGGLLINILSEATDLCGDTNVEGEVVEDDRKR